MATKKVRIETPSQARTRRKAKKVTVRNIIEQLAKCNWNDEITVVTETESKLALVDSYKIESSKIIAVSQSSSFGVRLVISDKS